MKTFLVNYRIMNKEYSFNLEAEDWEDAEFRLAWIQLPVNSWVEGELIEEEEA